MSEPTPDTAKNQGRDGGLRPEDQHLELNDPDVQVALDALEDDDA